MNDNYNTCEMSDDRLRQAFAKCFITGEGKIVLSFLRRITIERCLGPDSADSEFHYLEGQRQLVKKIEMLSGYHN